MLACSSRMVLLLFGLIMSSKSLSNDEDPVLLTRIGSIMFEKGGITHIQRITRLKKELFEGDDIDKRLNSTSGVSAEFGNEHNIQTHTSNMRKILATQIFAGDNFGDGLTYGDIFTGGLLEPSNGGDVYAWGNNAFGQIGIGSTESMYFPTLVTVLRNKSIVSVTSGSAHTLALSDQGLLYSWGQNDYGQLGLVDPATNTCTDPPVGSGCVALKYGYVMYPSAVRALWGDKCFQMSSIRMQNVAVVQRGVTFGWGLETVGQLGTNDLLNKYLPTEITGSAALRFIEVMVGGEHAIALSPSGNVYVWGSNLYGQLGQDILGTGSTSVVGSSVPIVVSALKGKIVVAVTAGWAHCAVITKEGETWVWGRNDHGQLGLGDFTDRSQPVHLLDFPAGNGGIIGRAVGISAGHSHTAWLNSDGVPFTVGRNDAGQLGIGDTTDRSVISKVEIPQRIWCDTPYGSDVPELYADLVCVGSKSRPSCGIRCPGNVRLDCGPRNQTVGLTAADCEPLMPISSLGIQIQAGEYNTYMISRDYNLYAWGSNTDGQIGIGSPQVWGSLVPAPQLVVELYNKKVSSVSGGTDFSVARGDREVFYMLASTPQSGAVGGGTSLDIIGRGYNTFVGQIYCRLSRYTNATYSSSLYRNIINATVESVEVEATRFSNFRIRCITPDIRYKLADGTVDEIKMSSNSQYLEGYRNISIWWRGQELKALAPLTFVYTPLPSVVFITPQTGPVVGGSYMIIQGYGFDREVATDVRVRFGDDGNNWMRGCILSDTVISTITAPSGPSNNGDMDYDGACNVLCPADVAVPSTCSCQNAQDASPNCIRGIVKAAADPFNRASRTDRCPDCKLIIGPVRVSVSLNGFDYTSSEVYFTYYAEPTISFVQAPPWITSLNESTTALLTTQYGGPEEGGTVVEFHGIGFTAAQTGQAVCMFGCSYSDVSQSIGPKCTLGTALHSLSLQGMFLDTNRFQFVQPVPVAVWDIIHFGTWFNCPEDYSTAGCPTYNKSTGILYFVPKYDQHYAPSFRGYNKTTQVVTSCIEACESRVEYINETVVRCTSRTRILANSTENVTLRLKMNGQDAVPACFATNCNSPSAGAAYFMYYKKPVVSRISPNGSPFNQASFIFVYGEGFSRFSWFPRCQFGKQITTIVGNSTTFPGWYSNRFQTNTSLWVINDTSLVCFSAQIPTNMLQLLEQDYSPDTALDLITANIAATSQVINLNISGRALVPFTIALNGQNYLDSTSVPFPRNPAPGSVVTSNSLRFIFYPHPTIFNIIPAGGIISGATQVIIRGEGFQLYNEMESWFGQLETPVANNRGAPNPNWFNYTITTTKPPYVQAGSLGWPQGDRNVGSKYGPNRTSSVRCRFGSESSPGWMTRVHSRYYGLLLRYEPNYIYSVWADYLDSTTLRCRAPPHIVGIENVDVALNYRDYPISPLDEGMAYRYYNSPVTQRVKPSGGPIEGGTSVLVFGVGFTQFEATMLCRFGAEMYYDSYYDRYFPLPNTTGAAVALNDSVLLCTSPSRRLPINSPFGVALNGQDYNMHQSFCGSSNGSNTTSLLMWDNPASPLRLISGKTQYWDPNELQYIQNFCPYVFYPQPVTFGLYPAGAPITGGSNVRIYGRRFDIFTEDIRCKFGLKSVMWTQIDDRPVGAFGRLDEMNCPTSPHLVITLSGPSVRCTLDCQIFPDDPVRCNMDSCSFNVSRKILSFKLAVAEIVGTRDVYGDINVLPGDIVIEDFRQSTFGSPASDIDVIFCIHCVQGFPDERTTQESLQIIEAVRSSTLLKQMKRHGLSGINSVEISSEPIFLMVALNGQDYTTFANNYFTFYLNPNINSILPAGGPLVRYDIADSNHNLPTVVEISGTGFMNYEEDSLCRFDDFIVPASVIGDRLMICQTPWPGITYTEGTCSSCIADFWLEVTLNGQDYTNSSGVNFRYYLQPVFATFSPLGGPVTGGTPVTFKGRGFNRFNDGSLRILWGVQRSFAEEMVGPTLAYDDFDPTPPDVAPLSTEYGIPSEYENVSDTLDFLSETFEGAQAILLSRYKGDKSVWEYEYAVISNQKCGGMDLPATASKVRLGYLPGDTRTKQATIQGQSLYFTGTSQGVLTGRYVITKALDLSRGASISMWLRRGNASSPLSCETPDVFDELNVMLRLEEGSLIVESTCYGCQSKTMIIMSACSATIVSSISTPESYKVLTTLSYPLINKTISHYNFLLPQCGTASLSFYANESLSKVYSLMETSDLNWLQLELHSNYTSGEIGRMLIPLSQFTDPAPGLPEESYDFQWCSCIATTGCSTPPCPDACDCNNVAEASCVIDSISASVAKPLPRVRTLTCDLPGCENCKTPFLASTVQFKIEYRPDASPPKWSEIPTWRRISVFDVKDVVGFTFYSENIYRNERGQRPAPNVNELTISSSHTSMVVCPRNHSCYNRKSRLMITQPDHGQGDFDNWAIDDFTLQTNGGIISDSEIIGISPPAHLALPLTETQRLAWQLDGRFLGAWMRPISIYLAMNNQSYEVAGQQNFCSQPGQTKQDPYDPSNTITCDNIYFNWDEPNWLFGTQIENTYTNWWEKAATGNWGSNYEFLQIQSSEFSYYQHPTIDSVTPSGGPTSGGTYVTIFGAGFAVFSDPIRTPKCKFGHFVAEAKVFADTMITCTTPSTLDAGYVDVVVSLNEVDFTSPTLGIDYSVPFLFYGEPSIDTVTPNSGPSRGGTIIVIAGSGFSQLPSEPACRFIGLNDPTVIMDVQGLFLNDTMIQCTSPAIAYLCTPSTYCDKQTAKDPNWRGCNKWLSCPFAGINGSAGCPWDGCLQYEDNGQPTRRAQPGEDILFDVIIQLSLNAFCCVRDGEGKITDPCISCTQGNLRCACVGDFTSLQTDQDSSVSNTFSYYREAEINSTSTMATLSGINPMENGGTQDVITVIGRYFRNSTWLQCGYKDVQNDVNARLEASPESATGTVYDSYYYLLSTQMLCTAPSFPGQRLESTGTCQVFLSLNGIDITKPASGGCPPDSCITIGFYTPESAEKRTRRIVAIVVPISVFLIYVYFQRQRYLKKNAKYVADTGGEWEKPSIREALHWQTENQVRKYHTQHYPIWRTSTDQLADLGVGIGLYFGYLKYMTKYFVIMSFMCIPSLVICSAGHSYPPSRTDANSAIRASIGSIGLGQTPPTLTIICVPGNAQLCATMLDKDASFLLAVLDCCISLVFIVATWRLKIYQERAIVAIDEDTITAADYTVLVDNIPGDATNPDELRAFFSKYGEVADVAIGLNNGTLIELFQKRGKSQIAIEAQAAKLKLYKLQSMQLELKKMKKNQQKLDGKILGLRAKTDFKSVCAFVTFNDDKGQQECLEAYSRKFFSNLFQRFRKTKHHQTATKRFRGKHNLIVLQSPEPSNILWENLQHKGMETHIRTFIALLIAIILLVLSFYLTLFLKALQDQLNVAGGDTICLDINVDDPGVQEFIRWSKYAQPTATQGNAIYQAYLACYCGPYGKQLDAQPVFCNDYVINTYRLNALAIGSVAAVIAINAVLQIVLKFLAGFIKPHTISALERAIASRIFFAQWINTAIIVVLINADLLPYLPSLSYLYDQGYLTGTYADTTEDWFVVVGAAVVGQSVSASIVPNMVVLAAWPIGIIKQHALKNRQMTQKKLNKLFEGSEYLLSARYAALLNILWVILTYNSSIPIMNFFGVVFFSTAYWCDKIALLRACKKPAQYDEKLAVLCTNMMSVGMIVHLAFSTWFFGYLTADTVSLPIIQLMPLPDKIRLRLTRKPAATLFFFFLSYVAFEIIARTFGPALVRYLAKLAGVEVPEETEEGNPPFFEALENQEISGLDTYNIKKNARYRDAFSSEIQTDTVDSDEEIEEEDDFGQEGGEQEEEEN